MPAPIYKAPRSKYVGVEVVNVRVSPKLLREIDKMARAEHRSRSNLITLLVELGLERRREAAEQAKQGISVPTEVQP